MKKLWKKWLKSAGKIIFTVGCFYFIYLKIKDQYYLLPDIFINLDWYLIIPAFVFIVIQCMIATLRWQYLLDARNQYFNFKQLYCYQFIGNFFSLFLPSSVSADIVKMILITHRCPKKDAFSSILASRLLGLIVLFCFVISAYFFEPSILNSLGLGNHVIILSLLLGFVCLVLFSKKFSSKVHFLWKWLFPEHFYAKIIEWHDAIYEIRNSPYSIIMGIITSIGMFLAMVFSVYFVFTALNIHIGFTYLLVYIPIIYFLTIIPISINGLGFREGLYIYFFSKVGIPEIQTISVCIINLFLIYFVYSWGGLLFIFLRRKREQDFTSTAKIANSSVDTP